MRSATIGSHGDDQAVAGIDEDRARFNRFKARHEKQCNQLDTLLSTLSMHPIIVLLSSALDSTDEHACH